MRDPRAARTLGLWTASWLAVLLVGGLFWVGDLSVQWPVLLIPVLWALVAVRPRRRDRDRLRGWEDVPTTVRTDTVERPFVRERPDRRPRGD
jgi:hypothetical protein